MKSVWLIFFFEIPRKFDCVRGCKFMSVVKHQPWGSRGCWWGWRKGAPSYNSTVHVQQHAQQGYLQVSYNTTQVVVVVVGFTIHTHISYSYQLLPYWPLVYQPCHRHISLILFTQVRACQSASTVVCACVFAGCSGVWYPCRDVCFNFYTIHECTIYFISTILFSKFVLRRMCFVIISFFTTCYLGEQYHTSYVIKIVCYICLSYKWVSLPCYVKLKAKLFNIHR